MNPRERFVYPHRGVRGEIYCSSLGPIQECHRGYPRGMGSLLRRDWGIEKRKKGSSPAASTKSYFGNEGLDSWFPEREKDIKFKKYGTQRTVFLDRERTLIGKKKEESRGSRLAAERRNYKEGGKVTWCQITERDPGGNRSRDYLSQGNVRKFKGT